jgi:hypothetical protein
MIRVVTSALIALTFVGCTVSKQQAYPNTDRAHLWTTMVAIAKSPEYSSSNILDRWIVVENNVDTNSNQAKIDVRRIIARSVRLPMQKKQTDRREILFSVYLLPLVVPTVEFVSHSSQFIPAQGLQEAERYFGAVETMLQPVSIELLTR